MNKIQAAEARGYQKAIDALRAEGLIVQANGNVSRWAVLVAAADWLVFWRDATAPAPTVHEGGTAREI